ncbi:MAG: DNA metabolism protein [Bacteroidetes bacterium HGW-Bacteroidetes-6]|jgi:probable DNA metabolism protein|nr:MAG: DNA metabolism protein [Bacteroidetes bacterium HGW-Bacteroidetes-6]
MNIWSYDNTFEGFLTLVFQCYDRKLFPDKILRNDADQYTLFKAGYDVISDEKRAKRVWDGLHTRISAESCRILYYAFLSEIPDIENEILNYIRKVFESRTNIEMDFRSNEVLEMFKTGKKVSREAHRILMFTRFQKTTDEIYYASFDPRYNVLPLTIKHFENRFADQKWIIYDTRRNFGFYYDMKDTREMKLVNSQIDYATGRIDESILDKDELLLQELWKSYFDSMCIKERINPKLHVQLLPKRFWKYLPEKNRG